MSGEEAPDPTLGGRRNQVANLDVAARNGSPDLFYTPHQRLAPDVPPPAHAASDLDLRESGERSNCASRTVGGNVAVPLREPAWQADPRRPSATGSCGDREAGEDGVARDSKRACLPSSPRAAAVALEDLPEEVLLKV